MRGEGVDRKKGKSQALAVSSAVSGHAHIPKVKSFGRLASGPSFFNILFFVVAG